MKKDVYGSGCVAIDLCGYCFLFCVVAFLTFVLCYFLATLVEVAVEFVWIFLGVFVWHIVCVAPRYLLWRAAFFFVLFFGVFFFDPTQFEWEGGK